jgi:hypothetical protein
VYPALLKYFNQCSTLNEVLQVARDFEAIIKSEEEYFKKVRKTIIEARRAKSRRL